MPSQPLSVVVRYEEAVLRRAVGTFMWRRVLRPRRTWLAAAMLLASAACLGWGAGPGWGFGLAGGGLVLAVLLVLIIWRAHLQNTLGRFRAMDPPQAALLLDEQGLTARSNLGSSTVPWSRFTERWELDGVWMLFLEPGNFTTVPTPALSDDARALIRRHVPAGPGAARPDVRKG